MMLSGAIIRLLEKNTYWFLKNNMTPVIIKISLKEQVDIHFKAVTLFKEKGVASTTILERILKLTSAQT